MMCDPNCDDFDTIRRGARRLLRHERFEDDMRAFATEMNRLAIYYETLQPLNDELQTAIRRLEEDGKW